MKWPRILQDISDIGRRRTKKMSPFPSFTKLKMYVSKLDSILKFVKNWLNHGILRPANVSQSHLFQINKI